jgi:parallel beta-helix repeat protein
MISLITLIFTDTLMETEMELENNITILNVFRIKIPLADETLYSGSNTNNSFKYQSNESTTIQPAKMRLSGVSQNDFQYKEHSPIVINGNANFSATATAESWSGDGSESTPYIIENLNITGPISQFPNTTDLIVINNTSIHFQIKNCYLNKGYYALSLINVTHGQIINNSIHNSGNIDAWQVRFEYGGGINLEDSKEIVITGNNISNQDTEGIRLKSSWNNTIIGNNLYKLGTLFNVGGIILIDSFNNIIEENEINNIRGGGISLSQSYNNLILKNNLVNLSERMGIIIHNSGNNWIKNNILVNNGLNIEYDKTWTQEEGWIQEEYFQAEVSNNSVNGKPLVYWQSKTGGTVPHGAGQIILVNSTEISITGQNLTNISIGIQTLICSNIIIADNKFSNNTEGIHSTMDLNLLIQRNVFTDNIQHGIVIGRSSYLTITENIISNTLESNAIIVSQMSSSINVTRNVLTNNHRGAILMYGGNNTSITFNTIFCDPIEGLFPDSTKFSESTILLTGYAIDGIISHNIISNNGGWAGIFLNGINMTLLNNTVTNSRGYGIYLSLGEMNTLVSNYVFNSGESGIVINESKINTVFNNSIGNNGEYGIYVRKLNYPDIGNLIKNNTIINNQLYGIYLLYHSRENIIKWNNFLGNNLGSSQAYDDGRNNIFVFNYWDDWVNPDKDEDGVVDYPYVISGEASNTDPTPLSSSTPSLVHILTPPRILYPNGREILNAIITISWLPALDSLEHSVNYFIYYSTDSGNTWNLLASLITLTNLSWDLSLLQSGTKYMVKVIANCSEGLSTVDTSDEPFSIYPSTIFTSTTPSSTSSLPFTLILLIISLIAGLKKKNKKNT